MHRKSFHRAGYLAASIALIVALASSACADSVTHILGSAGYKEPLGTPVILCQNPTTCERRTSPSFTSINRVWGGTASCRTSTNEGQAWANCTTQPLSSGGQEFYAEASDGSVLGVGRPAAKLCVIKRSTDNAATWATVFDSATLTCGGAVSGGTMLKCISGGRCVFVFRDTATGKANVLETTDSGQTWTVVFTSAAAFGVGPGNLTWDGTLGIAPPASVTAGDKSIYSLGASTWVVSTAWPVDGETCWGSFIMRADLFAMCYNTARKYHVRNKVGTVINNAWFPNPTLSGNSGGISLSPRTGIVYSIVSDVPPSGAATMGVHVSQDSGVTFNKMIETAPTNGVSAGDMWQSPVSGCYYTSGGSTQPAFVRIC